MKSPRHNLFPDTRAERESSPSPREGRAGRGLGRGAAFTRLANNGITPLPNPLPTPSSWGEGTGHPGSKAARSKPATTTAQKGSVLVIVIWVIFGLISITLYFANSMTYELRASDNRIAGIEAEQAIEGARRYVSCVLTNLNQPGAVPDPQSFQCAAVAVGNAKFWLIGRTNTENTTPTGVSFGLVDEASKLNLNSSFVGTNLLLLHPTMTLDVAYNIMAWRSTNTANTNGGVESDTYSGLQPPYLCKNAPFETVDELRMVYGVDIDLLYGEDANLNGFLDPNENDGDITPPSDNQDGHLDPGLFEYVTVYTHAPTLQTNGQPRIVTTNVTALQNLVKSNLNLTLPLATRFPAGFPSPLQFYIAASALGMSQAQFMQIEGSINGTNTKGLVNVNTASAEVLQCLPGMDINQATQVINYRQSNQTNPNNMNTLAWLTQVGLSTTTLQSIAPWVTGQTYQFTADVAAVGHNGRGYRRGTVCVRYQFGRAENCLSSRPQQSGLGAGKTGAVAGGQISIMINLLKKQRPSTVLGLTLDGEPARSRDGAPFQRFRPHQGDRQRCAGAVTFERRPGIGRPRDSESSGPGRHSRAALRGLHPPELGADVANETAGFAGG